MQLTSAGAPLPTAHSSPELSTLIDPQMLVLQGFLDEQAFPGEAYKLIQAAAVLGHVLMLECSHS